VARGILREVFRASGGVKKQRHPRSRNECPCLLLFGSTAQGTAVRIVAQGLKPRDERLALRSWRTDREVREWGPGWPQSTGESNSFSPTYRAARVVRHEACDPVPLRREATHQAARGPMGLGESAVLQTVSVCLLTTA
jgi:hypothetical protein